MLSALLDEVKRKYPLAEIVGAESPPFRVLSEAEIQESIDRIRAVAPHFVWVGLGAPKQELWMSRHWQSLKPSVLLGVEAAFDFHSKYSWTRTTLGTKNGIRMVASPCSGAAALVEEIPLYQFICMNIWLYLLEVGNTREF